MNHNIFRSPWPGLRQQVLVNRHQVLSPASRFGEAFLEELVKGLEVLETPVPVGANLAEVLSQFYKAGFLLRAMAFLPGSTPQHRSTPRFVRREPELVTERHTRQKGYREALPQP